MAKSKINLKAIGLNLKESYRDKNLFGVIELVLSNGLKSPIFKGKVNSVNKLKKLKWQDKSIGGISGSKFWNYQYLSEMHFYDRNNKEFNSIFLSKSKRMDQHELK